MDRGRDCEPGVLDLSLPESPLWQGRVDPGEEPGCRWHQRVQTADEFYARSQVEGAPVLLGFCCDEGVRRNQGRVGARHGPVEIRRALANLVCAKDFVLFDAGDIQCQDKDLEGAQRALAAKLVTVLERGGVPLLLGGGHEIAWASFLGAQNYLAASAQNATLGIINFDAHFDLRAPAPASSGSPFRQCHDFCRRQGRDFHYFVLGINPSANTDALFNYARAHGVKWLPDTALLDDKPNDIVARLDAFIQPLDYLYLTLCLDVFSACFAPGVSAPAALGIHPAMAIKLIGTIKQLCRRHQVVPLLCDVAEMNPRFDRDGQTARLAARLIYEVLYY